MASTMLTAMLLMTLAFWAYAFAVVFTRARAIILERDAQPAGCGRARPTPAAAHPGNPDMNWNSAAEFFAMGGYGLYVWGAYAVTARLHADRAGAASLQRRRRTRAATLASTARRGSAHEAPPQASGAIVGGVVAAVGIAAALVLNAFQSNLVFFYSPSQVAAHEAPVGTHLPHRRHGRGRHGASATARR